MMTPSKQLFETIGSFTEKEKGWVAQHLQWVDVKASEIIVQAGKIGDAIYFLESGACFQSRSDNEEETVIDLYLPGDWMFVQSSVIRQEPSVFSIRAFQPTKLARLGLLQIHSLISLSPAFLSLGRLFDQGSDRIAMFDHMMDPQEKYDYLMRTRPEIFAVFPLKMIASYLKLAPETLSRVRARYRIS